MEVNNEQTEGTTSRPSAFGRLVKMWVLERGWTQAQLAHAVSMEPASLSRVIRGRRKPTADLVLKISAALRLSSTEQQRLLATAGLGDDLAKAPITSREDTDLPSSVPGFRRSPVSPGSWSDLEADELGTDRSAAVAEVGDLLHAMAANQRMTDESFFVVVAAVKAALRAVSERVDL